MHAKPTNKNKNSNNNKPYYIYGKHPAIQTLQNPLRKIIEILCTEEIFNTHKDLIEEHPHEIVTSKHLNNLLPQSATHQGIAVKTNLISNTIESIDLSGENTKIAILDQITDPNNIGAIIRSAAAFNIKAIIMTHDNAAEENGVMAKISCGGIEIVPIIRVTNLRGAIDTLKKKGFWILGFDGGAKDFISQKALSGKIGIVLGSEGVGMRRLTTESCDLLLKIPIESSMESINVSNAAAIVFYEAYKNN